MVQLLVLHDGDPAARSAGGIALNFDHPGPAPALPATSRGQPRREYSWPWQAWTFGPAPDT